MIWILNLALFVGSASLLYIASEMIVSGLVRLARYFGWKEFVVAFFVMAMAASLPNFFVGLTSALKNIPQLSFGDIMGNNIIALTVAVALATFFAPKKELPADGQTIQSTLIFTTVAALLPLLLIVDNVLSRGDGLILILFFLSYIYWLFSKKERFTKTYDPTDTAKLNLSQALLTTTKITGGIGILFVASQGIVLSATFLATDLGLPLILVGIIILGLGSALPEIYFAFSSARRGETDMILGNLMGSVIIPASLILGLVAIIHPISSQSLAWIASSRMVLLLAIILFFVFTRSSHKISQRESLILLLVYLVFIMTIIFYK
ncbi:MAG: hypothetical protein A2589_00115 [Candidatus Vogelbacteria bacterium RIFOXYD1_FULL_46_19]|uniref:Sodium/calcium exchanger membrane region domain-containing protein n=1 Tax=Candidatus Vogelbacteria bacterium RIFOXYD1_FULL_46_19 TaxID=1802439 RepID=A0A1G2QHL8_9BACT|nr:MAG: hypothetical protein A2589_00115 [Candidatus Vogelbacteria bacterium RIFOXYD1_FULL_46_19]